MIYNGIIGIILASIIYFMLGGFLNLRYGIDSSIESILNSILSVLACILIIWFTITVLQITMKY